MILSTSSSSTCLARDMQFTIEAIFKPSLMHSCNVCTAHLMHDVIATGVMALRTLSSNSFMSALPSSASTIKHFYIIKL